MLNARLRRPPFTARAFVTGVAGKSAMVFVPEFNCELRVPLDNQGVQVLFHKPSRSVVLQPAAAAVPVAVAGGPQAAPAVAAPSPAGAAELVAPAMDYVALEALMGHCERPAVDAAGQPLPLPLPVLLKVGDVVPVLVQARSPLF